MILSDGGKLKAKCTYIEVVQVSGEVVYYFYPEAQGSRIDPYSRDLEFILAHTVPESVYKATRQFDKDIEDLLKE
jgi:hypothetical protein